MLTEFWTTVLAISLVVYLAVLVGIGFWSSGRASDSAEEYLLAGRSLPLPMAVITLLATWFGAGVMLTVTDEVAAQGLGAAALDPLGVSLCLVLAGWWIARPLWSMGILTVCDYYARRFHPSVEKLAALILIPSYFGWIAVQFIAVARLLELFFGLDLNVGIFLVMLAGTVYTMLGGLRAVVLTDVAQLGLVLVGVVWLAILTLGEVGWERTQSAVSQAVWVGRPWNEAVLLIELLAIGSLGNLPAQDLVQRFLCVRSAQAASRACYLAGFGYAMFGLFPVVMGLVATHVLPESQTQVVMSIAGKLMNGPVMVIFILAVISAVLSTIDGAILSPAGVMAQNLLPASLRQRWGTVTLNRICVVFVAAMSLIVAYSGASAYELLEDAYALMLVGLFVPLVGGLWLPRRPTVAAFAAMLTGTGLWLPHLYWSESDWFAQPWLEPWGIFLPLNLWITLCATAAFCLVGRDREISPESDPTREKSDYNEGV
jgi:Na+/proline symporter